MLLYNRIANEQHMCSHACALMVENLMCSTQIKSDLIIFPGK